MSKKTLNKANLEALGAEQLAALLIEVSTGSADIKRRLRLELSHSLGASELAHDVRKRLVSLRKSKSYVGWRKRKTLIKDLKTQLAMITEKIAPEDPTIAFELLWQFIEIAPSIYERVDDSKGDVGDVFRSAIEQFEDITPRAIVDPNALADRVWGAILGNGHGEWDGIIPLMAPTLGTTGLERLRFKAQAYGSAPLEASEDHEALQFLRQLRGGDTYAADRKASFVKGCLQEIAMVAGDTNAYIAQYSDGDLKRKDIAAEVAMLLQADGRAVGALELLLDADREGPSLGHAAWDAAYIACLTALERTEDAQAHRWASFEETLNVEYLRNYLKCLPGFDDVEAEDAAKELVLSFPRFSKALEFCINWPDLLTAAQLIQTRADEINADHYQPLTQAAEALRARHPLSATLLWRAMIDITLEQSRSTRYGLAADHLADCVSVHSEIADYKTFPTHDSYLKALQARHDRKFSFWAKVL